MSKNYHIKEIFFSLVGEGYHSGRAALFIRFTGCNLWSGKPEQKHSAKCDFCDTDFNGTDGIEGGVYTSDTLIEKINSIWLSKPKIKEKFIWLTGGEPALQVDQDLVDQLKAAGYKAAIETNGTLQLPINLDWVCVSPKANLKMETQSGDELKLVFPQNGVDPQNYEKYNFKYFYIQPKEEGNANNEPIAKDYCLNNPFWKLSLQIHKHLQIK